MPELSEERIAELIALIAPPPRSWIESAVALPPARAAIDQLTVRATADQQLRQAILADLEEALRGAGIDPRPELQESLRARLSELD